MFIFDLIVPMYAENYDNRLTMTDEIFVAFGGLEYTECLCLNITKSNLQDILLNILFSSSTDLDYEILSMDILRKTAEIYTEKRMRMLPVCKEISKILELFCDDSHWSNILNYFDRKHDKHLLYVTIKTLSVTMHTFPQLLFKLRLKSVLKNLTVKENAIHYLELLISLIDYSCNPEANSDNCKCENKVSCAIDSLENNFTVLCHELSCNWNVLLNMFLQTENQNMFSFLMLWKILCEKHMKKSHSSIFLKEVFAMEFMVIAMKMSADCLRTYVDIISQIVFSNLGTNSWHLLKEEQYQKNILAALSNGFLLLLKGRRTSSFYSTFISLPASFLNEDVQFDVIYKKVFFIVLSLLSEFRCALLLTEALEKVFDFLIRPINKWKLESTHFWIFDTFIEDDELLFGVMLAFLKIYCCLRKEDLRFGGNNPSVDMLRKLQNKFFG
ncbi:lines-like protein 1 [Trichonephila clavipes]|nr:lines-like protein 1 [Trichonephila clavipes]